MSESSNASSTIKKVGKPKENSVSLNDKAKVRESILITLKVCFTCFKDLFYNLYLILYSFDVFQFKLFGCIRHFQFLGC